jgi:ribonuclease J
LLVLAQANPDSLVAVVASGQNLDRLVSCFRASRRARRQLVIDPYQAYVLMKLEPLSTNIPQFSWDDVRVSFVQHQVKSLKEAGLMDLARVMSARARVSNDELAEQPGRYLMCLRCSRGGTKLFDKIGSERVTLVWSMWSGYWKRGYSPMREWAARHGVEAHFVHSGGHAWPEDLERLREAIGAKGSCWVHTDADPLAVQSPPGAGS